MPQLPDDWISASALRNYCMGDPLLDWLNLYGTAKGFQRDETDPELDLGRFLQEKGSLFEAGVIECLRDRCEIIQIGDGRNARDEEAYVRTLKAIEEKVQVIYQGVLHDSQNRTFGIPDLLVRSDVLNNLVDMPILEAAEIYPVHYRVVDIKFKTLSLDSKGLIGNEQKEKKRKAQLFIYNRALALAQGYEPRHAYLLGRSWKQKDARGSSCLERLAPADMADPDLQQLVNEATAWVHRVRREGAGWDVYPEPSNDHLYPNMGNGEDSPWHDAKKEIAERLGELTQLWYVSPSKREAAFQQGIRSIRHPNLKASVFGLAASYEEKLASILAANRDGPLVRPARIEADRASWISTAPLEFYVDFETVSDLDDDFSTLPNKGGQPLIFMVGCGHIEDGRWAFKVFTCERLTEVCEAEILDSWHQHMESVKRRLMPGIDPLVFHWSHAEKSTLIKSYNSAQERHGRQWPTLNWYDLLVNVARKEPVTIRGAMAFGLKSMARAFHAHGLIETSWTNGPGDGLQAMVGAWRCNAKGAMKAQPLMKEIERYNEIDCKVMQEILAYLRANH